MRVYFFSGLLLIAMAAQAGTVTGRITSSTSGGLGNSTLTFTLTQAATAPSSANGLVPGSIAGNAVNCWTDSQGNVVGLPGNAAVALPSVTTGGGSLPAGTYFVRYTWVGMQGETEASLARVVSVGAGASITLQPPVSVPANATGMNVYIGAASGGEQLQNATPIAVVNGALSSGYTQAGTLNSGSPVPAANTTQCNLRFNDELVPSYTGYMVDLFTPGGSRVAGFPQKWYLAGGSSGTVNVGVGTPLYSGVVQYPQAVVTNPPAGMVQSIAGPLNMNGFPIFNTVATSLSSLALSGSTSGFVTLQAQPVASGTLVFPNGGAVVTDGSTVTLSNKTIAASGLGFAGASSGTTTVAAAGAAGGTLTLPAISDTLVGRSTTDTLTNKTFDTAGAGNVLRVNGTQINAITGSGAAVLATTPTISSPSITSAALTTPVIGSAGGTFTGSTSGNTVVKAASAASGTLTLPAATDTLVGKATTDTLTNKTFDTAGAGNVLKIAGTQVTAVSGSGATVALTTSPALTTPAIGAASGNTLTLANQAAPSNPSAGNIVIYGDSGSGNLACRNSAGTSCLTATAAPPLTSGSANPAASGLVRAASGDTAVAFRNAANTADIVGLSKSAGDVVQIGGAAGISSSGPISAGTSSVSAGTFSLSGSTSGTTNVAATAAASGTLTLPAATDTLVGKATTDTLTNKTIDTAGAGNVLKIAGTQVTAVTGSGATVALATSPALTTPNIGAASGNTLTFVNQAAPSSPSAGNIVIYGDSGSGNLACRNSAGTSCLSATASPPVISGTANPAASGLLRAASGDTAVAFRNAANTADITALSKSAGDVVQLGGAAGISTSGPVNAGTNTVTGGTFTFSGSTSGTTNVAATATASGTLTLPAATDTLMGRATTDTLTNKTIDAEATGNTITLPFYVQIPAAGCNNATATSNWDLPTTNLPTANCLTGTNTQQGTLDFDDASAKTAQVSFALPPGWTGSVAIDLYWLVTAGGGSNTVNFTVATACSASAATFDTAFNTANTVTSATVGANNNINVTSIASLTMTGCAAGNVVHLKVGRDVADSSTATVRLLDVGLTIRRAM